MELQLLAIICVNLESNRLTGTALLSLLSDIYTAVNLMLHSLHYLMLRLHLIWWILKSCYNVLRLPSAFLALLFIGFARTFLIALTWWYLVTNPLLGSCPIWRPSGLCSGPSPLHHIHS